MHIWIPKCDINFLATVPSSKYTDKHMTRLTNGLGRYEDKSASVACACVNATEDNDR